jgi:predicted CoA-binding protein|tara:strand:+ start:280 stop:690 length:411 start_codon:yes stop_codon:yes gene_type:complete
MEQDQHSDKQIKKILEMKNVVVIGMSRHSEKAAHFVPKYLHENGFNITPVNPTADEILEKKCFKEINDVYDAIDIIDIFRPSDQVLQIIKDAIKKNPKVIWLQEGIHNEEAEQLARDAGIDVVYNRCMLAEHQRLM